MVTYYYFILNWRGCQGRRNNEQTDN